MRCSVVAGAGFLALAIMESLEPFLVAGGSFAGRRIFAVVVWSASAAVFWALAWWMREARVASHGSVLERLEE